MADQSIRFPEGIAKDIMVKIQDHYVPANFTILDMEEEDDSPIILERPFLNTTNAVIYVGSGQIHFQFSGEKVRCYCNSYTTYEQPKKTRSSMRRRSSRRQENQLPKNGWGDYDVEVVKDQFLPRWNEWDDEEPKAPTKEEATLLKSSPQTKQVWKEKVISSASQEKQSSESPSPRLDDAPDK
jgi:hypothetical protein